MMICFSLELQDLVAICDPNTYEDDWEKSLAYSLCFYAPVNVNLIFKFWWKPRKGVIM